MVRYALEDERVPGECLGASHALASWISNQAVRGMNDVDDVFH